MTLVQGASERAFRRPRGVAQVDLAEYGHARVRHEATDWQRRYRTQTLLTDGAAAALGVLAGVFARNAVFGGPTSISAQTSIGGSPEAMQATIGAIAVLWLVVLAYHGAYATRFVGTGNEEYRAVTRSAITLVAVIAFVSFALKLEFSRGILLMSVPLMVASTVLARYALRSRLAQARVNGECLQPTVIVGDARAVLDLADRIAAEPAQSGLSVTGICVSNTEDVVLTTTTHGHAPLLGDETATLEAVDQVGAKVVAVASSPTMSGHALRRLGWALEQRGVDLLIAPGIVEVAGPRLTLRRASGLPMLHVERPVSSGVRYATKMLADRLVALTALILISPILLVIGLIIRRDSDGPALFRQERVGEGGRTFTMLKFRTMGVDADARLTSLSDRHDGNDTLFKLRADPRVTKIGAVLRRYSLDELPQLINVVLGEMSLVGPRPPLPREVDTYESDTVRRLRVRPGMTGLWQVSGRSDLSWVDSVRLDLWYVDNWSLALDAQILVRTVNAVFRGRGAY